MIKKFKEGLTKNVILLGIVSGLTDISSEMLYPVIPIFLSTILNAPMSVIGFIEGIAEATASILKIYGGYLSDRFKKRKLFIIYGYSLSAISKPLMAFAFSWYFVLLARFIDRVGKGIRTSPRDALISCSVSKEFWGKAFGFHRAMDTFGAAIGPLLTLLILWKLGENTLSYRTVFIIAFIPAIAGVIILMKYVSEPVQNSVEKTAFKNTSFFNFSRDFKIFSGLSVIFFLFKFSDAFLIMKAQKAGFLTYQIIWIYFLYNILYTFLSTPAGYIADKTGKIKIFTLGLFVFAIVCFVFAYSNSKQMIIVGFAIYSFYGALSEGISKAIISTLSDDSNRATAIGIYHALSGISLLCASTIAGILWDKFNSQTPFMVSSFVSLTVAILTLIWAKKRRIEI